MSATIDLYTLAHVKSDPANDYILAKVVEGQPMYRRVRTEEELHRAGMEKWVGTIAELWDAIGKPVDEKRLDLYCRQLVDVPQGLLESGIAYAIRNNTFSTVPPIGLIWEGIRKELAFLNPRKGEDIKDRIERWQQNEFKKCAVVFS